MKRRLTLIETDQNILFNCHIRKQHWFLWHHINTVCKCRTCFIRCIFLSAYGNFTLIIGVDSHDNFHEGTLTGTIAANKCKHFTLIQLEIDPFEYFIQSK